MSKPSSYGELRDKLSPEAVKRSTTLTALREISDQKKRMFLRLAVLGPAGVETLARELDLDDGNVSNWTKILETFGVLQRYPDKRYAIYNEPESRGYMPDGPPVPANSPSQSIPACSDGRIHTLTVEEKGGFYCAVCGASIAPEQAQFVIPFADPPFTRE